LLLILGVAAMHGGMAADTAQALILAVAISMLLTPFILALHDRLAPRFAVPAEERAPDVPQASKVLVAGLGRIGQVVARMLHAAGRADHARRQSRRRAVAVQLPRFYGDATPDLLHAAGAAKPTFS
jgi:lactate dehydrogenase-like 2-hydroxyacid dehydrogenase